MNSFENLVQNLAKFPGIGSRQARRLAYFLMRADTNFRNQLARDLARVGEERDQCQHCQRFFLKTQETQGSLCDICRDSARDSTVMLVLEKEIDLETFQSSSELFQGKYFILGGVLPILEKNPNQKIRLEALIAEVQRRARDEGLQEVIFALSANPEGENTVAELKKSLAPIAREHGLLVSQLGRGLSTGTEIEYSDHETIKNAFESRS